MGTIDQIFLKNRNLLRTPPPRHRCAPGEPMSRPGSDTAYLERVTGSGVAVVALDHFPVNSLSRPVTTALTRALLAVEAGVARGDIRAVVLRGAGGRAFCAGADISAFGAAAAARDGPGDMVPLGRPSSDAYGWEEVRVPVVAALQGYALGGGFELSLGCHYRVMAQDAKVGLPEVNIGLLPGAQGTQRLPRLVGAAAALDMMLTGRHVGAAEALKLGLVDEVVDVRKEQQTIKSSNPGDALVAAAIRFAEGRIGTAPGRLPRISTQRAPAPVDFTDWETRMRRRRPGEPAPLAIVRCVRAACAGPAFADGVAVEQAEFVPLVHSPESEALRHMFFAERNGARVEGLSRAVKARPIRTVGVVGAGLMGGGIAMCCANAGMTVYLLDVDQQSLDRGMALVRKNYAKRRSLSREAKARALAQIHPTTNYADFAGCDLVVEAVFENMRVKQQIFRRLSDVCRPGAFLCSNTSALDIDMLADMVEGPERVMGTHFFSPANVMKLLENVRGARTSDVCVASMMAWGKQIGKWCVLVGNCPGFVGNRMIGLYGSQARRMLEEGSYPADVDGAATRFGMRLGPLGMSDMVGLALGLPKGEAARAAARKAGTYDPDRVVQVALVEAGRLGQRFGTGGFYDYDGRQAKPSPTVRAMLDQIRVNLGVRNPRRHDDEEIVNRLMMPLVNEGFKILEEGFARRPADIDVCYVHGYSFPRRRGGPMFWADQVGLDTVRATLEEIGVAPAQLLLDCVAAGQTLAAYWRAHGAEVLRRAGPPRRRGAQTGRPVTGVSKL